MASKSGKPIAIPEARSIARRLIFDLGIRSTFVRHLVRAPDSSHRLMKFYWLRFVSEV
jgi:hypothetical protein